MLKVDIDGKKRCFGTGAGHELYARYHDEEWGVPVHDDRSLFESLLLEGAQAGLSWETVLRKREGYRALFHGCDPVRVAAMSDAELERALLDPCIVRHRQKVFAARGNARAFLELQARHGRFADWARSFVDGGQRVNRWRDAHEVPASTPESEALSKALKDLGMRFVGPTIVYAWMQGTGLVDDHLVDCWRCGEA